MNKTHFNRALLVINVWDGSDYYEVDLEHCRNSAELLDWILQIADKQWSSERVLQDFIACLEDACQVVFRDSAQGVYCPNGHDRHVDWAKGVSKPSGKSVRRQ